MKRNELRQMKKNEALNKIIKAHSDNGSRMFYDEYDYNNGFGEQRDWYVTDVLNNLKRELDKI